MIGMGAATEDQQRAARGRHLGGLDQAAFSLDLDFIEPQRHRGTETQSYSLDYPAMYSVLQDRDVEIE